MQNNYNYRGGDSALSYDRNFETNNTAVQGSLNQQINSYGPVNNTTGRLGSGFEGNS